MPKINSYIKQKTGKSTKCHALFENANSLKRKDNFYDVSSAYFLSKAVEMASLKRNRVGFHNYSTPLCGLGEKSFHNNPFDLEICRTMGTSVRSLGRGLEIILCGK